MRDMRRIALLLAVAGSWACAFDPVPVVVRAGTTVLLPLDGEWIHGAVLGYESEATRRFGVYDDQRGELVFLLREDADAAGPEHPLVNRWVTRAYPDPASLAGLRDGTLQGEMSQVIALLDVPVSTPPGRYVIEIRRRRRADADRSSFEVLPALAQPRPSLEVLPAEIDPATGAPVERFTSEAALWGRRTAARGMLELYPWPKVVIRLEYPAPAARLVVAYPQATVGVLGVVEDLHSSSGSIVRWHDSDPPGELTIDLVDPDAGVRDLAVVFHTTDPFGAGIAAPEDFHVVEARLYGRQGQLLPYGARPEAIR